MEEKVMLRNMTAIYLLCGEEILLLYRSGSKVVNNVWVGSAGGHFEETELNDPRGCVLRELQEELGILECELTNLQLRYIVLRKVKGEIRQNYYFFAEIERNKKDKLISNEGNLKWFSLDELSGLEMPPSAKQMIEHYLVCGRFDNKIYVGVSGERSTTFSEFQED